MNKELLTAVLDWSDDEELSLAEEPITPPLDRLAVIGKWDDLYVVENDYSGANFRGFDTHREARLEAARLWLNGEVSQIRDHTRLADG